MAHYLNFGKEDIPPVFKKKNKWFPEELIFLKITEDSVENRMKIRKIISKNNPLNLVLVSESELSRLAWKANLFHYVSLGNDLNSEIGNLIDKLFYIKEIEKIPRRLKLKHSNGYDILKIDDILYCKADGNYSHIYFRNGKRKVYTIQLNRLTSYLSKRPNVVRIGKSLIINLNYITRIKKEEVTFSYEGKSYYLTASQLMTRRIKKELIWI